MPTDYWHRLWTCPFYDSSGKLHVKCEGGCRMVFPDVKTALIFLENRCASEDLEWKSCSTYIMLTDYYERKLKNEKGKTDKK
jgi:hypothetical protein